MHQRRAEPHRSAIGLDAQRDHRFIVICNQPGICPVELYIEQRRHIDDVGAFEDSHDVHLERQGHRASIKQWLFQPEGYHLVVFVESDVINKGTTDVILTYPPGLRQCL